MIKFKDIITEIGDNIQAPSGAIINMRDLGGSVKFNFDNTKYSVYIRVIMKNEEKMAVAIDFIADGSFDMTNKNKALQVMSYIVGAADAWLKKYVSQHGSRELIYIKYDPKKEDDELGNRRDVIYKYYINKFAKSYGSNVTHQSAGGMVAKFEPAIQL